MSRLGAAPHDAYARFRAMVSLQSLPVDHAENIWKFYDYGPRKDGKGVVVFIPGLSGTADVFYKQLLCLCPRGYRCLLVEYPALWSHEAWATGFCRFLDTLGIERVHIFGQGLGGFLAQFFCYKFPYRTDSLMLCNSFYSTIYWHRQAPHYAVNSWMPEFMLKRYVLAGFPQQAVDPAIADSIDFMVERLERLKRKELASRLTLSTMVSELGPLNIREDRITIIDVLDQSGVPDEVREELYVHHAHANFGYMKNGGPFVFLSRDEEVNVHILVHLRKATEPEMQEVPVMPLEAILGDGIDNLDGERTNMSGREIQTSSIIENDQHNIESNASGTRQVVTRKYTDEEVVEFNASATIGETEPLIQEESETGEEKERTGDNANQQKQDHDEIVFGEDVHQYTTPETHGKDPKQKEDEDIMFGEDVHQYTSGTTSIYQEETSQGRQDLLSPASETVTATATDDNNTPRQHDNGSESGETASD